MCAQRVNKGNERVIRFTIWDNFRNHERELREIGAEDRDIEELRKAALLVERAERDDECLNLSIAAVSMPVEPVAGWIIGAPAKEARYWAQMAAQAVTGGQAPTSQVGQTHAIISGLWALWQCSQGHYADVMQTVCNADALARQLAGLDAQVLDAAKLPAQYMALMGIQGKKKAAAEAMMERKAAAIQDRLLGLKSIAT